MFGTTQRRSVTTTGRFDRVDSETIQLATKVDAGEAAGRVQDANDIIDNRVHGLTLAHY